MHLASCEIKSMRLIFKTEMLIYQSKANLDEEILFGILLHLINPDIREMLVKELGNLRSEFYF